MESVDSKFASRRKWKLPLAVLVIGLLVTCAAALYVSSSLHRADESRFQSRLRETEAKIRTRLAIYIAMLRGTNSFCVASYPPTQDSFRAYSQGLNLQQQYPGVQGLGLAIRYTPRELGTLLIHMRTHGSPQFKVWPDNGSPERTA